MLSYKLQHRVSKSGPGCCGVAAALAVGAVEGGAARRCSIVPGHEHGLKLCVNSSLCTIQVANWRQEAGTRRSGTVGRRRAVPDATGAI